VALNFIPNDPMSGPAAPQMRSQLPRPNRPAGIAGFTFTNPVAQGLYSVGTPEFLFWQCREAALAALETWESFAGELTAWSDRAANQKNLPLQQQGPGNVLNAFYDRQSFSFFKFVTPKKTTLSGSSTDVVSHEVGHGLLDSVRTDLFDSMFLEAAAFHEGFADCIAILTALNDQPSRQAVLAAAPDLGKPNFIETTAEDLSDGVLQAFGPKLNSSSPRHALNSFAFQIPSTLPPDGPPSQLINESHSFGQVFSGSFYDCLRNIFASMPAQGEQELLAAAQSLAKIVLAAVGAAPLVPRFIESVGRSMISADLQLNGGANQTAIQKGFAAHAVTVGSTNVLAPRADLAGGAPGLTGRVSAILDVATRKDLLQRIGAPPKAKLAVDTAEVLGQTFAKAVHYREVPLGGLDKRLAGVVTVAEEPMFVGSSGKSAILMGSLPEETTTQDEVQSYVESLLEHDRISFNRQEKRAIAVTDTDATITTHTIRVRNGKKVLVRERILCS
jgi:Fungalysin metallopeptidase (M36)